MKADEYIRERKRLIEEALERYLPGVDEYPRIIHEAIHYSVFNGGKRIRPILVIASYESCGGRAEEVLPTACAVELIHTYSLIHDDLPALDNDDYRRGKLSCHRAFGEAVAILTGDALLSLAFEIVAKNIEYIEEKRIISVIKELAFGSGSFGMVGGQVAEIISSSIELDSKLIHYIHTHKTGSLFRTAVRCGGILAGVSIEKLNALTIYGENIGFAFQIIDDLLDLDKKEGINYAAFFGRDEAKKRARELIEEAKSKVTDLFGKMGSPLRMIGDLILERISVS